MAPLERRALSYTSLPRFFQVGTRVQAFPGAPPVDTTGWLRRVLEQREAQVAPESATHRDDDVRLFVYAEADPVSRQLERYALVLPQDRPYSANDRVAAYWSASGDAFDFAVAGSQSFGSLVQPTAGGTPLVHRLKALLEPSGTNAQAHELIYEVEGTGLRLLEHKGLIPGLPVAFERFRVYRPNPAAPHREPEPIAPGSEPLQLTLGLLSRRAKAWAHLETFETGDYRVLVTRDESGGMYFLAARGALAPHWYFGGVATDLVIESSATAEQNSAENEIAAALIIADASAGLVLTGQVKNETEIADYLARAAAFLDSHDRALLDLREHGSDGAAFLRHFAHTLLETHRSRHDPRAITALPYGDHFYPANARASSASIRYGSDQASVLLGLSSYERRTRDPSVLDSIWDLTASSLEARTPLGEVYAGRFDTMLVGSVEDPRTGRADVLLDNGAVAVAFNHLRLVQESGQSYRPLATWGAFGLVIDGRTQSVDQGGYAFSIDPSSLPTSVRTDQDVLSVSRFFTRTDAQVRVREEVELARGVAAVKVSNTVENIGSVPWTLGEVQATVGDFFHYSDGANEVAQNRYGMSPVLDGVPLHVGVWMEGLGEPLWGDAFPPGWVDVSAEYHRLKPRFVVVYGYDRAQAYYVPELADQVLLYNAGPGARQAGPARSQQDTTATPEATKDGYEGWTTLQFRYRVERRLNPGDSFATPAVYSYSLEAPLFSADGDQVPDELQALVPLWAELLDTARRFSSHADLIQHLESLPDRAQAQRLLGALHNPLQPDAASIAMLTAWIESAELWTELARTARDALSRAEFTERAHRIRAAALEGASFAWKALTQLRGRFDLMPSHQSARNFGYHVFVFDWAYRQTEDPRYRDAMLFVADRIAGSEQKGGLQVTDASKPNYGAYIQSESQRGRGASNLDDQGIKLWALRRAFDRTHNPKYRASAELFIEHWLQVRSDDHLFFGVSKWFERYIPTGAEQRRTPLGHYALMVGLRAWADLSPAARALYARGLRNATELHPVHAIGTTGPLSGVFPDERVVHFETDAELGGMFLLSLALDRGPRP